MKNVIRKIFIITILFFGISAPIVPSNNVGAINVFEACDDASDSDVCKAAEKDKLSTSIKSIINILLRMVGIVAVVVIIIGGILYTLSNGDSGRIKSAKDTILYAVIGLVVAILAYAIVNFVVGAF